MDSDNTEKEPPKDSGFAFYAASWASVKHPDRNEDMVHFPTEASEKTLWVGVFDGVGGEKGGYEASHMAEEIFRTNLSNVSHLSVNEIKANLEDTFSEAVLKITNRHIAGSTTVTVGVIFEKEGARKIIIASVGDSRAYLLRGGKLEKLTDDDSVFGSEMADKVDNLNDESELSGFELSLWKRRNLITQSLGGALEAPLDIHFQELEIKKGDKLIFTTDGIHDNLTSNEMELVLIREEDVAQLLCKKARERSNEEHFRAKHDDMSVVVMEVK